MSKGTRRMWQALHTYARDNGWCYPSVGQLAAHADLDERQARRALRWLEAQHYIESQPRTGQTTIYRLSSHQERGEGGHLPPTIEIKRDLNPKVVKACERPPVIVPVCSSLPEAELIACEGGASYTPADDWTLTTSAAPERKPWQASILPKEFFTLYRAPRERHAIQAAPVSAPRMLDDQPSQAALELESTDELPRPTEIVAAQADALPRSIPPAQLGNIEAQIWRRPPTDPKKRRTYYALQGRAAQVERSNPRQAHALRRQARNLEEVSELLIATTSCTDELEEPDADRRQIKVAPVTARASSELPTARSLPLGIQRRPRLVNVTHTQPNSTSSIAGAAPGMTGGRSHAHPSVKLAEVDELWLSLKRREISRLEQQGHPERAAALRRMLGWEALGERGHVAVGDIDAIVPELSREFQPSSPFVQTGLDTAQEKPLSKRCPQAVQALALDVEIGAGVPQGVLQAATKRGAVGPEPMASGGNVLDGGAEFSAANGVEAGADDAFLTALGIGAAHVDRTGVAVEIGIAEPGDLGMAQAGGVQQVEHAHQFIAATPSCQGSPDLDQLLRTVTTTGGAAVEAGVEVIGHQLIGPVGVPLPTMHPLTQLAEGSQGGLEVSIGGTALPQDAQAALDQLRGHITEHTGLVVAEGIEEDHVAIAVGVEGAVAENPLVVGAVALSLMAGSAFLEQAPEQTIDLVLEGGAAAHQGLLDSD